VIVVPDALSNGAAIILTEQKSLIEEMRRLTLKVVILGEAACYMALVERIKEGQADDKQFQKFRDQVEAGLRTDLIFHEDGSLRYGARSCVPKRDFRQKLLTKAHNSPYNVHPNGTKIY